MKLRDERQFEDSHYPILNAITGEVEKPAKGLELNSKWQAFKKRWSDRCFEEKGVRPEINEKERFQFFRVRKLYGQDQIESIVDYFLADKKSNEHLTINACFSADTINGWKLKERNG